MCDYGGQYHDVQTLEDDQILNAYLFNLAKWTPHATRFLAEGYRVIVPDLASVNFSNVDIFPAPPHPDPFLIAWPLNRCTRSHPFCLGTSRWCSRCYDRRQTMEPYSRTKDVFIWK